MHWFEVLAQAGKGAGSPVPGCAGGGLGQLMPIVLMFVVIYFLMIRPQQKRQKEHRAMLEAVKPGDRVVTNGGLLGKVTGVSDRHITLELAEKIRVRVLRNSIMGPQADVGDGTSTPPEKS